MRDLIFLKILDMSRAACLVIAVIFLARLCLKRAPKMISYLLWVVVLVRLLCPVSIESAVSILPEMESVSQDYTLADEPITVVGASEAAYRAVGDALNGGLDVQHIRTTERNENGNVAYATATRREVWLLFGKYVWLAGMVFMLVRAGIQTFRLRRRLVGAVPIEKGVFLADHMESPFVMGLLRPRIYLPSALNEDEREYILLHERHHIHRGDHITRALAFAALCLHWFNPLVWLAFFLSGRDMEMSCDESVIRHLGGEIRAEYAASLLRLTTGRRTIAPTPLAFGEGDTGGRIRNLSRWKKPLTAVMAIAVVVCSALAVCLLTDPVRDRQDVLAGSVYTLERPLMDEPYIMIGTDEPNAEEHGRLMSALQGFTVTADMHLYVEFNDFEVTQTAYWGALAPYEMSSKMKELIGERVTDAYILRREDQRFLLFMQTKRGDTLYAYGWEDISEREDVYSDDSRLYALYRLQSVFDEDYDKSEFFGYSLFHSMEQPYGCIGVFAVTEMPDYTIVGFAGSDSWSNVPDDMGYAVFRSYGNRSGYRLLDWQLYSDVMDGTRIVVADPAVLDERGRMTDKNTYDIILSANSDLEKIVRYGDNPNKGVVALIEPQATLELFSFEKYTTGANVSRKITSPFRMTVFAWRDFAKDKTLSTVFYDKEGKKMVADMPERVSISLIEDNKNIRTVTLSESNARMLINALENTPLWELDHPVYHRKESAFTNGYIIRIEHVVHDEYVLHDDMTDCFVWEYEGEYYIDGYKYPEGGRHIQRLDLPESLTWTYVQNAMMYPIPERIKVIKYADGVQVGEVVMTDEKQIAYWSEEMRTPLFQVSLAFGATAHKYDNGYVLRMEYAEEDVAREGVSYLDAHVWMFMDKVYYDGYTYPTDPEDDTTWGSDLWFAELNRLFEPAS